MTENNGECEGNLPNQWMPPVETFDAYDPEHPRSEQGKHSAEWKRRIWRRCVYIVHWCRSHISGRGLLEAIGVLAAIFTFFVLKGTLDATKQAAKAAKVSADVSAKALEFGQGASLTITLLGPQCLKADSNRFTVQVDNLGRLDATHVTPLNLGVIPGESTCSSVEPNCVKSDLISPVESPYFCPVCYQDSRRWLVVHPVELAKRTGDRLSYTQWTRVLTADDLDRIEFTQRDEDGRMLIIAFAVFRYWDGFRCRLVSSCGQYVPRFWRDGPDPENNSGAVCDEAPIPLRSCEYPVTVQEEQNPEECEQPGPQPTRTPRSLRDRLGLGERINPVPRIAPTYNPFEPIPKPAPVPVH